jgi:hypothetical protein
MFTFSPDPHRTPPQLSSAGILAQILICIIFQFLKIL